MGPDHLGVQNASGGGKRIRVAPSFRGPSRRQRARPPLSTGRPNPFPSPTPRPAGAAYQPVSPHLGRKAAGCEHPCPRCGPDHGGLATSGSLARAWTVGRNLPRFEPMSIPQNVTDLGLCVVATGHRGGRGSALPALGPAAICYRTVIADRSAPRAGDMAWLQSVTRNFLAGYCFDEIFFIKIELGEDYLLIPSAEEANHDRPAIRLPAP
jgi:hypothetical protein